MYEAWTLKNSFSTSQSHVTVVSDKIAYRRSIVNVIYNTPEVIVDDLRGKRIGKQVVYVAGF
jgi:NADPH-dependent curcumin reductase CurA